MPQLHSNQSVSNARTVHPAFAHAAANFFVMEPPALNSASCTSPKLRHCIENDVSEPAAAHLPVVGCRWLHQVSRTVLLALQRHAIAPPFLCQLLDGVLLPVKVHLSAR